jgi:hypothetical protein
MSSDPLSQTGGDEPRLTWRERELLNALRRLANARAQLRTLEDELARHPDRPTADPDDVERVETYEAELRKLRAKAASRFGGGAARDRVPEVEARQRVALERLGFDSYGAFAASGHRARDTAAGDAGDPALVEFARHEVDAAAAAYAEVLALPDENVPAPAASTPGAEPDTAGRSGRAPTIDLTSPEAG